MAILREYRDEKGKLKAQYIRGYHGKGIEGKHLFTPHVGA